VQPKIYTFQEHQIPVKKIDRHAYYVIQKLRQAGFEAYLVGGSVRDLLLNRKPKDFDISTSARPEEIKSLFRNCLLIGKRFRLAHIRFGKKLLEVSTFRSGDPTKEDLILRDNAWGSAEEDVLRRDFTINGLYYDPENETVIDYVGGVEDAKGKTLRTIGKAETRFRQDPVRMIRLLKFKARFDFIVDPLSMEALYECKEEIIKSSQARILEELLRMLESGSSSPFFRYLYDYGLLELLLKNLAKHLQQPSIHTQIFSYLDEVDNKSWQDLTKSLERPVLLCCLLFPILHQQIMMSIKDNQKQLHLGHIAKTSTELIHNVFHPFFHIPKKMKAIMVSILTSQFRFTPLQKKQVKRLRIPRDPFFSLGLKFFKLRVTVEPEHLKSYTEWSEAMFQYKKGKPHARSKKVNLQRP
jgi:poly(A) polymerase